MLHQKSTCKKWISTLPAYLQAFKSTLSEPKHSRGAAHLTSREQCRKLHNLKVREKESEIIHKLSIIVYRYVQRHKDPPPRQIPTSKIQNCGVFIHSHHVASSACVIPKILFSQVLNDKGRGIDMCLVAVERPAKVCWWY